MTFEGLTIEKFGFTEVVEDDIPYHVAGFAKASCATSCNNNDPYQYIPPKGWEVTSCIVMPSGTHGVPVGQPTVLVWCKPTSDIISIDESPGLFPQAFKQIGGLPGFIIVGATALGLVIGFTKLAKKKQR